MPLPSAPNRYEVDLSNEVLNIHFGEGASKISEVKVGDRKKNCWLSRIWDQSAHARGNTGRFFFNLQLWPLIFLQIWFISVWRMRAKVIAWLLTWFIFAQSTLISYHTEAFVKTEVAWTVIWGKIHTQLAPMEYHKGSHSMLRGFCLLKQKFEKWNWVICVRYNKL